MLEALMPEDLGKQALKRIQSLDCLSSDKTLPSCDPPWAWVPPLKSPFEAAWRKA
jgi:hypothetical protein